MRLDKYLKVSRLVKRRTVANELCDAKHVTVNGKVARASYDVKVGDEIEITMGSRVIRAKVLTVVEHATKETAGEMYQLLLYVKKYVSISCLFISVYLIINNDYEIGEYDAKKGWSSRWQRKTANQSLNALTKALS